MNRLLAAGLMGTALLGPALAQTASPPANPAATPSAPPPASAPATPFLGVAGSDLMVSNLIDLTVYTEQNQRVGEIVDLVMDGVRGVRAVIIGSGAAQGGAERHVAVDPAALRLIRTADGSHRAVLNATADQVKAAPEVRYRGAWSE